MRLCEGSEMMKKGLGGRPYVFLKIFLPFSGPWDQDIDISGNSCHRMYLNAQMIIDIRKPSNRNVPVRLMWQSGSTVIQIHISFNEDADVSSRSLYPTHETCQIGRNGVCDGAWTTKTYMKRPRPSPSSLPPVTCIPRSRPNVSSTIPGP
jgi:hypothetical protein